MKSAFWRHTGLLALAVVGSVLIAVPAYRWLTRHAATGQRSDPNLSTDTAAAADPKARGAAVSGKDINAAAVAFCGGCHAMPPADSFPKSAWHKEVEQGYDFFRLSSRTDLVAPPQDQVVALFRDLAPERLTLPELPADEDPPLLAFQPEFPQLAGLSELPAIAHLKALSFTKEAAPSLVYCDMHSGEIGALGLGQHEHFDRVLATLANPCHVEPCDLDRDGVIDLVVAVLGSFTPSDHRRGRVVLLRRESPEAARWEAVALRNGLGRVADVQPADFDADGDVDLVVAEFGWREAGRILLLRNAGGEAGHVPQFDLEVLDSRHGAIHVPVVDLNGDGLPDFVALISQEHEVIEAFLNTGKGTFRRERIYEALNPAFGSTGIQLVDLDGDGDTDVLYTNGDAMDSFIVKPYHGVQWLENTGTYPFVYHHLAVLPGASRALAGDLDRDGLLDVVAVAYLPDQILAEQPRAEFDSIIWLKQDQQGRFSRHRIERGNLQHMALSLADADGDGLIDILTGNFAGNPDRGGPRITIWRQLSKN
jgi:hypothetical protein